MPDGRPPEPSALAGLLDVLLPGDGRWPPASRALDDLQAVRAALPDEDRGWLDGLAASLAGVPEPARAAFLRGAEEEAPEPFGRLVRAAYGAYYNAALPLAAVRRLVEAGPHDPSGTFDTTLLRGVIARNAGARRL